MHLSAGRKWFAGVGLVLTFFSANAVAQIKAASAPAPTVQRGDSELQRKRLAFMKDATAVGLIIGIDDTGPITSMRVGGKFISLSFKEQEDILNILWAYYITEDPQKNVVLVIDQTSGREIGEYSPANGGLKMK